jgi:hypothetical protein
VNFGDAGVEEHLDVRGTAFGFEEVGDVRGGVVAEKLAESFFVVGDTMLFDESDEVSWSEAGEGGFGEVGIGGEEIFGSGVKVGEIAAAAAGNEDFLADAVGVLEKGDTASAFSGFNGAEQTSGAGAEDEDIEGAGHS